MKNFFFKSLKIFLLIFVSFHCIAIVLLVAPKNKVTPYYKKTVENYTLPLFSQVYLVFGPQFKGKSRAVLGRCKIGDKWTRWIDLHSNLVRKHQKSRISHYGYAYRIYEENIIALSNKYSEYISKNKDDFKKADFSKHIAKETSYMKISRILRNKCDSIVGNQANWSDAEFRLTWKSPKSTDGKTKANIEQAFFPKIKNTQKPLNI